MPRKNEQELIELVERGEIVGFTLDTTEFHHAGYNFQSRILRALGQFARTDVALVFSEVVLSEVHAHLRDDVKAKSDQLRSALRQIGKAAVVALEPAPAMLGLGIPADPGARATELIDGFIGEVKAERIPADEGPTVRRLTDLYFSFLPPFSKKADKKSEFPDAIALLSLEHWAEEADGYVLAVSNDGDWSRFAEASPRVVCVPALAPALNAFNRDDAFVAARIAANLAAGTATAIQAAIDAALNAAVEIFDVEATSQYSYDTEDGYATIDKWDVTDARFDVVDSDDDFVTLAFPISVKATFETSFSFSIRDGVDRDYVGIGGTQASTTEEFDVQVVLTIARDDDDDNPQVVALETDVPSLAVDFGYVEVDYGDDRGDEW